MLDFCKIVTPGFGVMQCSQNHRGYVATLDERNYVALNKYAEDKHYFIKLLKKHLQNDDLN